MHAHALRTRCRWGLCPQTPGIYRLVAKMARVKQSVEPQTGRLAPPLATSAAKSALRLRPRRALSSAQPWLEWTTIAWPRNDFSLNGAYPLLCVSQQRGAPHERPATPGSGKTRDAPRQWREPSLACRPRATPDIFGKDLGVGCLQAPPGHPASLFTRKNSA